MEEGGPIRVLVCAATYQRPALLRELLQSLRRQTVLMQPGVRVEVAILDNDPAESGRAVVEGFAGEVPVRYVPVPEPGLTAVRNRAIELARDGYEFLAMLDDDEAAEPGWLEALLDAQKVTGAPVVCGRRVPVLGEGGVEWVRSGGFFDEPRYRDLGPMPYGHTANTLVATEVLRRYPFRFDPAMAFSGGEDVLFFAQLLRAGERIVYAHRAAVTDQVPAERIAAGFLLRRAFRSGGTLLVVERKMRGGGRAVARRLVHAAGWVAQAMVVVGRRPWLRAEWLRGGCKVAMAAGTVCGLVGVQAQPYAYGRKRAGRRVPLGLGVRAG